MKTKHKLSGFDLVVYENGFSMWHRGLCVVDASTLLADREVIVREGGEARLKLRKTAKLRTTGQVQNEYTSHVGRTVVQNAVGLLIYRPPQGG